MAKPYFTPSRCSAEIPISPYDGEICGALADLIAQEGPRCQSCADEFGFTPLEDLPPAKPTTVYHSNRALGCGVFSKVGGAL